MNAPAHALPLLIVTVGLPVAGKSTWARGQGWPIVNPDSIRRAIHGQRYLANAEPLVWASAAIMVRALFHAGHARVIVDATNLTRARRARWLDPSWRTVYRPFPASAEECTRRARQLHDLEIIPIIAQMSVTAEPLTVDEPIHE